MMGHSPEVGSVTVVISRARPGGCRAFAPGRGDGTALPLEATLVVSSGGGNRGRNGRPAEPGKQNSQAQGFRKAMITS